MLRIPQQQQRQKGLAVIFKNLNTIYFFFTNNITDVTSENIKVYLVWQCPQVQAWQSLTLTAPSPRDPLEKSLQTKTYVINESGDGFFPWTAYYNTT